MPMTTKMGDIKGAQKWSRGFSILVPWFLRIFEWSRGFLVPWSGNPVFNTAVIAPSGACVDEACVQKNSEFYRGVKVLTTFWVLEVKEACPILSDFAKIPNFCEVTRRGIF